MTKEGGTISGNVSFQIFPNFKCSVNDLGNIYLKFNVKTDFIYTTDAQLAQTRTEFLGDQYAANFIS
jgi:hypothetical protein